MKNLWKSMLMTAVVSVGIVGCGMREESDSTAVLTASNTFKTKETGTVFHVVAFRFKTDKTSRAKIPAVVQAFRDLQKRSVDGNGFGRRLIQSLYAGQNNSTEQVSFGAKGKAADRSTEYTFILTFKNVQDRDYYVDQEPAHQAFKRLVGPLLENGAEGVFVTDFTQK